MDNEFTLDYGLEIVRKRLLSAQKEIFSQLESMVNPDTVKIRNENRPLRKHGIKTKKNDYRDYYWITVYVGSSTYWITLFYNDLDEKSGNFHTQTGRIQFWKNIQFTSKKGIGSPNRKDIDGKWYFCSENSQDPNQRIDSEGYSAQIVAERFLDFLETNGERNIRKSNFEEVTSLCRK